MASDGPTLERSGEVRERPSLEGQEPPHHDATGLQRTAEIHETESGNVELRKDPGHTSKPLAGGDPEHILDPRGASVATKPEDILAVRRDKTDTHLE